MKKVITILMLMVAIVVGSQTASADTVETALMSGSVGKYKVKMKLWRNLDNNTVTGWYYYTSKGANNKIKLSGRILPQDEDNFFFCDMVLTETVNGKVTGTFRGSYGYGMMTGDDFEGTWTSPQGKSLHFEVNGGGRP